MNRQGHEDVDFFVGTEVERTPSSKTLWRQFLQHQIEPLLKP